MPDVRPGESQAAYLERCIPMVEGEGLDHEAAVGRCMGMWQQAQRFGRPNGIERRAAVEVRATGRKLEGYAAAFGTEARIAHFVETVARGAFARSLAAGGDVLALVDHDSTRVLARTRAGTLALHEDSRGLHFETTDLPNTSWANDTLELVRSGNAGGASFAFSVAKGGERWQGNRRTLTDLDLHEVSVVAAWPAYEGTAVSARARMPARLRRARAWLETV